MISYSMNSVDLQTEIMDLLKLSKFEKNSMRKKKIRSDILGILHAHGLQK